MTETPNPYIVDADTLTGEMRPIRRCVFALGSNLGERHVKLQGAVDALRDTPGVFLTAASSIYETDPINAPEGSDKFLNAVVLADSTLSAHLLLERALAIETAYGRERTESAEPNAPRQLDVDIVLIGDRRADDEDLTLPHPRAHERAFVLAPWAEVEPEAELPGQGRISDLLDKVDQSGIARRDDISLEIG